MVLLPFDVVTSDPMGTRQRGPSGRVDETPRHRALGTASRAEILRLVADAETGLTAADVVAQVGLHPSTVRAHLEQLVDAGLLMKARASDGAPGRPAWRYRAAAPEPAPGPYRILAKALLDHLATGGLKAATRAGQEWGHRLAATMPAPGGPVEAAVHALQGLGFQPRRHSGAGEAGVEVIHLHACPFLELVGDQPDTMCAVHAGLIRGVVQASGAPRAQAVLEPFAAPTACVVRLQLPKASAARPRRRPAG
jgi:predicted ArsR family transcriptional regulator